MNKLILVLLASLFLGEVKAFGQEVAIDTEVQKAVRAWKQRRESLSSVVYQMKGTTTLNKSSAETAAKAKKNPLLPYREKDIVLVDEATVSLTVAKGHYRIETNQETYDDVTRKVTGRTNTWTFDGKERKGKAEKSVTKPDGGFVVITDGIEHLPLPKPLVLVLPDVGKVVTRADSELTHSSYQGITPEAAPEILRFEARLDEYIRFRCDPIRLSPDLVYSMVIECLPKADYLVSKISLYANSNIQIETKYNYERVGAIHKLSRIAEKRYRPSSGELLTTTSYEVRSEYEALPPNVALQPEAGNRASKVAYPSPDNQKNTGRIDSYRISATGDWVVTDPKNTPWPRYRGYLALVLAGVILMTTLLVVRKKRKSSQQMDKLKPNSAA